MAERIVSPGVFTQENDLSYLPKGLGQIGAMFIGRTQEGPAFKPVTVSGYNEFYNIFGEKSEDMMMPYGVAEYLKSGNKATIVRVLSQNDTFAYDPGVVDLVSSDNPGVVLAVLRPTYSGSAVADFDVFVTGSTATVSVDEFILHLSGSDIGGAGTDYVAYTASIDPESANYIGAIFGNDEKGSNYLYLAHAFESTISASLAASEVFATGSVLTTTNATMTTSGYSDATSPIVVSQTISGQNHQLFRFTSLDSGTSSNTKVKITISNIKNPSEVVGSDYGSFDVGVRKYTDTDSSPVYLETFNNVNLDPTSVNYICKRIGDQYYTTTTAGKLVLHGNYPNKSKYVRVSMLTTGGTPEEAVPFGFIYYKKYSGSEDAEYKTSQQIGDEWSNSGYLGIDFTNQLIKEYHKPLPTTAQNFSSTFLLSNCTGSNEVVISTSSSSIYKKFIFGLQGGFDGFDPRLDAQDQQTFGAGTSGSADFKHAIDIIKNPDQFDFNILEFPDLYYGHGTDVYTYGLNVCESRADAFMLINPTSISQTIDDAITNMQTFDTSYAAAYYPWTQIYDDQNEKNVWVPPSVVMVGVIAYTDKVAHEWFAPAGLNRGGITSVIRPYEFLNKDDRNELYSNRINPIASFPDTGVVAYGQKTLQARPSALDRINVRRMMIKIKKLIASAGRYIVFEQNNEETWDRFKNMVMPILDPIVAGAGITEYRVKMDSTTNTADTMAQNIIKGEIWIKPTLSGEFLVIDFNVMAQGASFEEI